jgi:ferredoxin
MMARQGDDLPVSALPVDGTYPSGTSQYEKRNVCQEVPVLGSRACACSAVSASWVCPHGVIRAKVYDPAALADAPDGFQHTAARDHAWSDLQFTLQVAAEDCTGCSLCVAVCPAKNKAQPRLKAINMAPPTAPTAAGTGQLDLLPVFAPPRSRHPESAQNRPPADAAAPLRILRGLRGLRGNPLHQAGHPTVRRSHVDCQRHRLFLHLRRQPAHHPPTPTTMRGAAPPGLTPSLRTTRNLGWASGCRWISSVPRPGSYCNPLPLGVNGVARIPAELATQLLHNAQRDEADIYEQTARGGDVEAPPGGPG